MNLFMTDYTSYRADAARSAAQRLVRPRRSVIISNAGTSTPRLIKGQRYESSTVFCASLLRNFPGALAPLGAVGHSEALASPPPDRPRHASQFRRVMTKSASASTIAQTAFLIGVYSRNDYPLHPHAYCGTRSRRRATRDLFGPHYCWVCCRGAAPIEACPRTNTALHHQSSADSVRPIFPPGPCRQPSGEGFLGAHPHALRGHRFTASLSESNRA
jgi:hypothetical protein